MLEVLEPGLLTTVQGRGRPASTDLGVPFGGACDTWSLAVANAILRNAPDAPAVEMTLAGGTFRALADCAIAVGGAEMECRVMETGESVAAGSGRLLRAGETLGFEAAREGSGARTYLALAGGVDVPEVLGSPSTCLVGSFGGHQGRALRPGDRLQGRRPGQTSVGRWPTEPVLLGSQLRVLRGPHADDLPPTAYRELFDGRFVVGGRGDRQGIQLEGPALDPGTTSIVSQPMAWGAVQLPPDGRPIVLLADHQTVGGYPVLAVAIGADHPVLAQLGPGDEVAFSEVSFDQARMLLAERRATFAEIAVSAHPD